MVFRRCNIELISSIRFWTWWPHALMVHVRLFSSFFFYIDPVSSTVKWAYKYSFTQSMHLKEYKNSCEEVLGLQTLALSEAEKNVSVYSSPMPLRIRVQRQEGSRCCSTLVCTVCVGTISAGEACVFLNMFFST